MQICATFWSNWRTPKTVVFSFSTSCSRSSPSSSFVQAYLSRCYLCHSLAPSMQWRYNIIYRVFVIQVGAQVMQTSNFTFLLTFVSHSESSTSSDVARAEASNWLDNFWLCAYVSPRILRTCLNFANACNVTYRFSSRCVVGYIWVRRKQGQDGVCVSRYLGPEKEITFKIFVTEVVFDLRPKKEKENKYKKWKLPRRSTGWHYIL